MTPISLELDGRLAVATLCRPPVNAIDEPWLARLDEILSTVEAAKASILVIRSSERAFCAGADLELMRNRMFEPAGRARMVAFVREIQRVYARLEALHQVTLAEIAGPALGGGLELALACDLRVAATEARLGLPEARLGLLPGAGGTQRLARIAGEATAKRVILGAEVISGAEAAALGVVQWSAPAAEARRLAHELAALPPAALAWCKRCITAGAPRGYEMELEGTAELLANEEAQRRVQAFLQKKR